MTRSEILQISKPILFNTEMVRAILDGRKTVTRRVVKPQHLRVLDSPYHKEHPEVPDKVLIEKLCKPPYKPGDYLYVRETCQKVKFGIGQWHWEYRADTKDGRFFSNGSIAEWRPSTHMPKEAARIFLRVTGVRVERLQEMPHDAPMREGIYYSQDLGGFTWGCSADSFKTPMRAMKVLWDSTIPPKDRDKYGWAANPWVFVIEFERVEVTE